MLGQNCHCFLSGGGRTPAVEVVRAETLEGRGVHETAHDGGRLIQEEATVLDTVRGSSAQCGRSRYGRCRVVTATNGRPLQSGWDSTSKALSVKHRNCSALRDRMHGDRQIVWSTTGGDDISGSVKNRIYDEKSALAAATRAKHRYAVLD